MSCLLRSLGREWSTEVRGGRMLHYWKFSFHSFLCFISEKKKSDVRLPFKLVIQCFTYHHVHYSSVAIPNPAMRSSGRFGNSRKVFGPCSRNTASTAWRDLCARASSPFLSLFRFVFRLGTEHLCRCVSEAKTLGHVSKVQIFHVKDVFEFSRIRGVRTDEGLKGWKGTKRQSLT